MGTRSPEKFNDIGTLLNDDTWYDVSTKSFTVMVSITGTATADKTDTDAQKNLFTGVSATDMYSIPYKVQAVKVVKTSGTGTVKAWVLE